MKQVSHKNINLNGITGIKINIHALIFVLYKCYKCSEYLTEILRLNEVHKCEHIALNQIII